MQLRTGSAALAAALVALGVSAPVASAAREPLNAYRVAPTQENKQRLAKAGYDMVEADHGEYLEIYGTAKQAAALTSRASRPRCRARPTRSRRRPPTSRSAATRSTTSGAATTACRTTTRSSTSSSMTGSRA